MRRLLNYSRAPAAAAHTLIPRRVCVAGRPRTAIHAAQPHAACANPQPRARLGCIHKLGARRQRPARTHAAADGLVASGGGGDAAAAPAPSPPSGSAAARWLRSQLTSPFDRELFALALPALAAMMLDPLMNVIDAGMVGHLGTSQLGAMSMGSMCIAFSTFLFSFLLFLTTPRVAAASVSGDRAALSRQVALGLWLAGVLGVGISVATLLAAPAVVAAVRVPDAALAGYATQYIQVRAPGVAAILLGFVGAGTYRGMKDTRTPLLAAFAAMSTKLVLNCALIYGLGWGVFGSGLASTIANWVSCSLLLGLLVRRGALRPPDLLRPPPASEVLPMVRKGLVLSIRVVITFGAILYGSAMCVRTGATNQAAFEILRQVWLISMQVFECLNVATQGMCASLLGAGEAATAGAVLRRALVVATTVGAGAGLVLLAAQAPLVSFFTSDAAVLAVAGGCLPLVAACLPLDAAASIMDGGLMAASQTDILSAMQVAFSLVQLALLVWIAASGSVSVLNVWMVLKLLSGGRFLGGFALHFLSPLSAYAGGGGAAAAPPGRKAGGAHASAAVAAAAASATQVSSAAVQRRVGAAVTAVAIEGSLLESLASVDVGGQSDSESDGTPASSSSSSSSSIIGSSIMGGLHTDADADAAGLATMSVTLAPVGEGSVAGGGSTNGSGSNGASGAGSAAVVCAGRPRADGNG